MKRDPASSAPESGSTLLSAPQPAQRWEVEMDERLGRAEGGLEKLESRLDGLEREVAELRGARPSVLPQRAPLPWGAVVWLAVLVVVALAWRLMR